MTTRATRILVIRFSSIGDIVLTAPAVASLRQAIHGPCEIHYLTKANMAPVVKGFGALVDHVHTIEESTAEVQEALKGLNFDYVVDLHNNVRSRSIKRTLGLISFTVDKQNWAKWLLVRGWIRTPVTSIVERYVEAFAGAFGAVVPERWPAMFEEASAPAELPATYAVLAIGATHSGKQLTPSLMQTIVDRSSVPVVLIGGLGDTERAKTLEDSNVISLIGKTTLAESAAVLRGARHVYAGDTGMMHLAAAVGTPVTSFWGCTRPSLGMAPWNPAQGSAIIVPDAQLSSRPCSKLGNRCRHANGCMTATEQVYSEGLVK
jgi:ADP-heptose:LPS heptosyltransferase